MDIKPDKCECGVDLKIVYKEAGGRSYPYMLCLDCNLAYSANGVPAFNFPDNSYYLKGEDNEVPE